MVAGLNGRLRSPIRVPRSDQSIAAAAGITNGSLTTVGTSDATDTNSFLGFTRRSQYLYTAEELAGFGWAAYTMGQPVDVVVLQADHEEYRTLSAQDIPGAQVVIDGRHILDRGRFEGIRFLVVGQAEHED